MFLNLSNHNALKEQIETGDRELAKKRYIMYGVGILSILLLAGVITGIIDIPWDVRVSHQGVIQFYAEGFASDDTTDYDGAGTLEFMTPTGELLEPAFTLGTDTESSKEYSSGAGFWYVWKSTTASAWDHYSVYIELPFGNSISTEHYKVLWSPGSDSWIVTCYMALETTPTITGHKTDDSVWSATGTNTYDLSDNEYEVRGYITIAVAVNYGGLVNFYDPEEEADGIWDNVYLYCDSNITTANVGFEMAYDGWKSCNDGEGWYYKLNFDNNILIRWDQEQMAGTIKVPFKLTGSVLDTATTTNDCELSFTLYECNDDDDAFYEQWDSDTLGNFAGSVTAEVVDITV